MQGQQVFGMKVGLVFDVTSENGGLISLGRDAKNGGRGGATYMLYVKAV